jgi:phage-related protein
VGPVPIFSAGSASVSIVPDFSGAQKAIGEFFARQSDIKVKVTPDLAGADVARTEAELNAMHGTAKVEVDRDFLGNSIATAFAEAFSRSGLDKLGSVVSAAISPTLITAAAGALTELAAAASQAVGILALAPAAIAAIAAPAAVVAIGVHGIGDAFKAIDTGNADKIAAAMANLAPAAQNLVVQVHALGPAWTSLRLDVQQSLLNGVGTAVTNLANVALPILHTGLVGIAAAMNEGLLATMTALQGQGANFATLFTNIGASLRVAAGAAAPLVEAFGTLGAVGSQFLPVLAQGFVNVATAFNNWVQRIADSGQLVVIIQNAINVIEQLGRIAGDVISVVSGIFTAALPYGNAMLSLLEHLTGSLAAFVHSTEGQSALATFFGDINQAVAQLIIPLEQVVQVIIADVLPAIGQFAALLAPIAGTLLVQLAAVLTQVAGILPPVVSVMAALFSAMAPLIPVIGTLITTLLPPLVVFFGQLAPIIGQVATILGGALLQAAAAIAPILPQLGDAFIKILNALLPLVPPLLQIAQQLLPPLLSVVSALIPVVQGLVDVFVPLIQTLLKIVDATVLPFLVGLINGFAAGLKVLAGWLGPLAPVLQAIAIAVGVWTAAQWLLNIAMDANPIGIIILAIGALITVIGLIATHLDEIKAIWNAAWAAIKDFFEATWNAIRDFFVGIWTAIVNWFNGVIASFVSTWQGVWTGIRDFFVGIWNAISTFAQTIWSAIAGFFANAWNSFTAAWSNFWNSIFAFFQNIWNSLVAWAQSVWNSLAAFFTNAWNSFTAAWSNFWNAIFAFFQNLWNTLVSWIQNLWNSLASWFAGVWNAFTGAWTAFWNGILSFFQGLWNGLVSWVQGVWNGLASWFSGVWATFKDAWDGFWDGVSKKFNDIWNGIKDFAQTVWDDIKAIIATPINFVIRYILNDGLFKAWNAVNDFLHLPWHINDLALISGFAGGGYTGDTGVFGTGDREDPAGIVHAREFVFTANQVDNAGGPNAMYAMASQLDSGFARGGLVRQQASDPQTHLNSYVVPPTIAPRVQHFLDALSAGQAEAVQATGGFDALGPGFYYGGYADPISAGVAFAAQQNGKPYIWGGVGPTGYDCSGFQSAITNVLRNATNPYHRVGTTADFPWAGFTSGLTSAYAVGATKDAGGGVGHMAATLNGMNAESGGAHNNVAWGGPAAGATASLFNIHASLPQVGGVFTPGVSGGTTGGTTILPVLGKILTSAADVLAFLTDSITGGTSQLEGQPAGGNWLHVLAGVPKTLLGGLWGIVKDAVGGFFSAVTNPASGNPTTNAGLLDQAMAVANLMYGWNSAADRTATNYIVSNESGWNPTAQNPTSTASGLWQQIDSTWIANRPVGETAPHMKGATTNNQDHAGFKYIHDRYKTLPAAQAYWAAHHYYDEGGWLPPGHTSIYNGTGQFEAVLNSAQQTALTHVMSSRPDGGDTLVEVYIGNERLDGHIDRRITHQQSQDARTIRSYR